MPKWKASPTVIDNIVSYYYDSDQKYCLIVFIQSFVLELFVFEGNLRILNIWPIFGHFLKKILPKNNANHLATLFLNLFCSSQSNVE